MHVDMLLVNLRMEAMFLKETFNIKWVAQTGLVENIEQIVEEYKQSRGLLVMVRCMLFSSALFLFFSNRKGYTNISFHIFFSKNT